jgi:fluoride exporter
VFSFRAQGGSPVGFPDVTRSPFDLPRAARRPRPRWDILAAIFVGGCAGGAARYGMDVTWPAGPGDFPWTIFAINTSGAFVLALVIVAAADVVPSRYLRPLAGTGFCGAFTTFSSIAVTVDELVAHGHQALAAAYLTASIGAGLAAGWLGLAAGRAVAGGRRSAGIRYVGDAAKRPE